MNFYTAYLIKSLAIIALTAFVFYQTDSWWSLVILIFLTTVSSKDDE